MHIVTKKKKVSHLDLSHAVERYLNNSLLSHITFKNKCAYF